MKKTILMLLIVFGISFFRQAFSCSCDPHSFCNTAELKPDDVVLMGKIIEHFQNGIRLEVIEVFRGAESRSEIIIWDGADFDCNGPFSMQASEMGELNDTIITILPLIAGLENPWDVAGDYRRPEYFCYNSLLNVHADTVYGFISGFSFAPDHYKLLKLSLQNFRERWTAGSMNCTVTSVAEINQEGIRLFPNPAVSEIWLEPENKDEYHIAVVSMTGELVREMILSGGYMTVSGLPRGEYIFLITNRNSKAVAKKVVIGN